MRKLHFYAFSFSGTCLKKGVSATASAYVGFPNQLVTVPRIQSAKKSAGVTEDSVLTGLAYMGHMTLEQAKGKQ